MKRVTMLALVGLFGFAGMAQQQWCGSDAYLQQYLDESPENRAAYEAHVQQINQLQQIQGQREGDKHIIPVVFHVLWQECEDNISMAQIQDGLRIINEDFSRTNLDAESTREEFLDVAADAEIEFRLARLDPDGGPTNGVVRVNTSQTVGAQNNVKGISNWPSSKYLNIWVVQSIANFGGGGGIILGYAQFPNSGSWSTYGIVIRHDAVGTIGTSSADGRTLTHEIGHCLGLYHTFQDGCGGNCNNSGDYICDTPPAAESTQPCDHAINTCSNDAVGSTAYNSNVPDMIENYMSYNSCQNIYTLQQKDRMKSVLTSVNTLINLTSEDNLIETGVKGLIQADFMTTAEILCQGEPAQFNDASSYDVETHNWSFGGAAQPEESEEKNPAVVFPYAGVHTVSYDVSLNGGTVSTEKSVFVAAKEGQYAPFTDDIESVGALPQDDWLGVNIDMDEYEWKVTTEAAYSGSKSLKMDNYGNCGDRKDELITQSFDFSPYTEVDITFQQAFALRQQGDNDFLRLYVSADCGENWELNWVRGGSSLASVTNPVSSPFAPEDASEWQEQSITLNSSNYMREGVLLKFEFVGRGGNNLFLDDFQIQGTFSGELLLRAPFNGQQGMANDVTIDWKAVGGVGSYEYQVDKTSDFSSGNVITGTNAYIDETPENTDTEAFIEGLNVDQTYYWRVRTVSGGTPSDWSDVWSFTVSETGVGVGEEPEVSGVQLYPNPAKNRVFVKTTTSNVTNIRLMDYTGRRVMEHSALNQQVVNLSLDGVSAGMYLIQVSTADGQVEVQPLVVNK